MIFLIFFENPIYDMSSEESVYSETYEICKEEQSEFSYDQSELYLSIFNEELEKQYSEGSDWVQLIEYFFQPSYSHTYVPYDLEQFGAYTQSYHRISPCDEYDDLPHHTDVYINPIQSCIEEAYGKTNQFGKQFDDLLYVYDLPSCIIIQVFI